MDEDAVERALDDANDRNKRAKVEPYVIAQTTADAIPNTQRVEDGTATEVVVPRTYTILTTKQLRDGNKQAVRLEQNRTLSDEFLDSLDPDGTHVVFFTLDHENYAGVLGMRCGVYCKVLGKDEPVEAFIDLRHADYQALEQIVIAEKA